MNLNLFLNDKSFDKLRSNTNIVSSKPFFPK